MLYFWKISKWQGLEANWKGLTQNYSKNLHFPCKDHVAIHDNDINNILQPCGIILRNTESKLYREHI